MNLLSSWTQEYSDLESLRILSGFAYQHSKRMANTTLSCFIRDLRIRLKEGLPVHDSLMRILEWEVSYDDSRSPLDLYEERQALAFFSKSEFLDIGVDRETVAYEKFTSAEAKCRDTNILFRKWSQGDLTFSPSVCAVYHRAAKIIASVLKDVPDLSEIKLRFGPGASTAVTRRRASARQKLSSSITCSENLAPMACAILNELPLWSNSSSALAFDDVSTVASVRVEITPSKLSFVPKNAKTFRAIATEPVLNGLCQLGLGDIIAKRLLAFGVDIRDQSRNQRLAREGSLTGALATLDLSSASDTISTELVYSLLPIDWACLLDRFRSRTISFRGQSIVQEKFSSMGNGFTFPLETLIFWALTRACCSDSETVSVYGDDIICPSHRVDSVIHILHHAGFSVNTEKSYWKGPFRESCGADYFRGFDIRPVYHKSLVSGSSLFTLHNFYKRSHQEDMAQMVLNWIPEHLRLFGPDGFGDGHLIGDWIPRPHKRKIGYSGFIFDTFTHRNVRDRRAFGLLPGDGVLPFYSIYSRGEIPREDAPFELVRKFGHGRIVESLPSQDFVFPGWKGYKRVSIYTLTNG